MKKILAVFFLITNLFLFMNIYDLFCEKDVSDVFSIFGYNQKVSSFSVAFYNNLNKESKEKFYSFLEHMVKDYDIDIIYADHDDSLNSHRFYIMTEKDMSKTMNLVTKEKINFITDTDSFYTNDRSSKEGKYFYLLNPDMKVEIRPFKQFVDKNLIATEYDIYYKDTKTRDAVKALLQKNYGSYIQGYYEPVQELLDVNNEFKGFIRQFLILSFIITMVLLLFMLSSELKKISIMKLNGYSSTRLALDLFFSYFAFLMLLSFLLFTILFFLTAGSVNVRTVPFIKYLATALTLEIPMLLAVLALNLFILKGLSVPRLIKNSNFNLPLLNANYIIKIIFLIIFLPQIFQYSSQVKDSFRILQQLKSYKGMDKITYIGGLQQGYQFDGYDIANILMKKDYDNPMFKKYQETYDYYNKKGAIYCDEAGLNIDLKTVLSVLKVNMNYIKLHPVYNKNGEKISLENQGKKIYILVPEDYLKKYDLKKESFYTEGNETEIIAISSSSESYNYAFVRSSSGAPVTQGILQVYTDDAFRADKSIFQGLYFKNITAKELNDSLEAAGYKDKVVINNLGEDQQRNIERLIKNSKKYLLFLILTVLIVTAISVEYAYLYFKANSKRILIKKLNGYSFGCLYSSLILQGLLSYMIPLLWMYKNGVLINYTVTAIFVFLELAALFVFHKTFGRNAVSISLKTS